MIARARKRNSRAVSAVIDAAAERGRENARHCEECSYARAEMIEARDDLRRLQRALDGQIGALKRIRSEMRSGPARELADDIERTLNQLDPCWRAA